MAIPTAAELMELDNEDDALDWLFLSVDDELHAGSKTKEWPVVEAWLDALDPVELSPVLIVGVLSITFPIHHLGARRRWYDRAREALREKVGDRADRMVRGLKERDEVLY